jgi:hypothetical protein
MGVYKYSITFNTRFHTLRINKHIFFKFE